MDGNNSLKRVGKVDRNAWADERPFAASDYYLPDTFVEQFANEVKARKGAADVPTGTKTPPNNDASAEAEGDPTDGAPSIEDIIKVCVKNWKAAKEEQSKGSWGTFHETGIFASACRHGLLLWIIDMVQSGEL